MKVYYICDSLYKVRSKRYFKSANKALEECEKLKGRKGRYFINDCTLASVYDDRHTWPMVDTL